MCVLSSIFNYFIIQKNVTILCDIHKIVTKGDFIWKDLTFIIVVMEDGKEE